MLDRDAVEKLIMDGSLRHELQQKGREQATHFDLLESAEKLDNHRKEILAL